MWQKQYKYCIDCDKTITSNTNGQRCRKCSVAKTELNQKVHHKNYYERLRKQRLIVQNDKNSIK